MRNSLIFLIGLAVGFLGYDFGDGQLNRITREKLREQQKVEETKNATFRQFRAERDGIMMEWLTALDGTKQAIVKATTPGLTEDDKAWIKKGFAQNVQALKFLAALSDELKVRLETLEKKKK